METSPQEKTRDAGGERSAMPESVPSEYISLRQMQEMLQIGSTKAYEIAASGAIPGVVKIGRIIRINRRELEGWLREQSISGNRK